MFPLISFLFSFFILLSCFPYGYVCFFGCFSNALCPRMSARECGRTERRAGNFRNCLRDFLVPLFLSLSLLLIDFFRVISFANTLEVHSLWFVLTFFSISYIVSVGNGVRLLGGSQPQQIGTPSPSSIYSNAQNASLYTAAPSTNATTTGMSVAATKKKETIVFADAREGEKEEKGRRRRLRLQQEITTNRSS